LCQIPNRDHSSARGGQYSRAADTGVGNWLAPIGSQLNVMRRISSPNLIQLPRSRVTVVSSSFRKFDWTTTSGSPYRDPG